jgi:thiamine biosynthesis lipoprotein
MHPEDEIVRVGASLMATRFEVALWGNDESYLRSAGMEALHEIERIEQRLSIYRNDSDLYETNAVGANHPVCVTPFVFHLLERAKSYWLLTDGAFDPAVGPLLKVWGFLDGSRKIPSKEEIEAACELCGMGMVELDEENHTVHLLREGVILDPGAIGKGYAIDYAAEILRDNNIPGALIHGGTSSIYALGTMPDGAPWKVALQNPLVEGSTLGYVDIIDQSLSVSAPHGKLFHQDGRCFGHVLDPKTGWPAEGSLMAAVIGPTAEEGDAFSTALLIRGQEMLKTVASSGDSGGLVLVRSGDDALFYSENFGLILDNAIIS